MNRGIFYELGLTGKSVRDLHNKKIISCFMDTVFYLRNMWKHILPYIRKTWRVPSSGVRRRVICFFFQHIGGEFCLLLHDRRVPWRWRQRISSRYRISNGLYRVLSQKRMVFKVTAGKISDSIIREIIICEKNLVSRFRHCYLSKPKLY